MADEVPAAIREVLAAVPAGCSWLLPIAGPDGAVTDFTIAAAGGTDLYRRGSGRAGKRITEIYPSIVGGPLWELYLAVLRTGTPGELRDFRYDEREQPGVVPESVFDVTVSPVRGGLLVWWQRLDEDRRRIERTERLGNLGWTEYDLVTGVSQWSPGMYRIFGRAPARGPMSRAEQAAAVEPEDRGLAESAWQTLDAGDVSDVTVRFRIGPEVKHLRILSDLVRDTGGAPLKINAVVQDVTARATTRDAIERLNDELKARELTALAEHRLAGRLQTAIQPVPVGVVALPGLRATVNYLPAERAVRVGGDWYHVAALPDGRAVLAVGDVAGHGLAAASSMAHLRFALIAWLSIGLDDPGVLLGHLNRLCIQLGVTGTAIVAVFDPATRAFTWGRAGHPAPLLGRGRAARPLEMPAGPLLGAVEEAEFPVLTPELAAGDLLLLYTDGLVERREEQTLLADVLAVLASAGDLKNLADELNRPSPDDDTCTVALQIR